LAILAYPSFRLLYDPVANSSVDVANLQRQCKRAGNFKVVFQGLNFGKKCPWWNVWISIGQPCRCFYLPWAFHIPQRFSRRCGYGCNKRAQFCNSLAFFLL